MGDRPRGVAWAFWRHVKDAQADVPLTDTELQRLSGIARTTIDRLETGKRPPQARVVHALADALHIDRDQALREAGLKPGADGENAEPASDLDSIYKLVENEPSYTEDQRNALLLLMRTFDAVNRGHTDQ
ncbi:helix-turn-helix domain-containing protein [Actinoplanes sp. CA-252034]|uniref:helix-turn-helix domain-containing protein n=1 Tax=Actinoplanes sp. CA-252034 TaxID=3239906 RepID=UPI003D95458C